MKNARLIKTVSLISILALHVPFLPAYQSAITRIVGHLTPAAGENECPKMLKVTLEDLNLPVSRQIYVPGGSRFEFEGVPWGRYRLTVEAEGRAPSWLSLETAACGTTCVVTLHVGPLLKRDQPVVESSTVDLKDLAVTAKARKYLEQANREIGKGEFRSALVSLEKAVSIQADLPMAYSAMGQTLMKLKRADEAEKAFARALELVPDYPSALKGIGYLYLTTGREELAIAPLSKAAVLNDRDDLVQACLGEALYHSKRYKEAEAPLQRALLLNPDNFRASYRLGYVYLELRRYREALAYFRLFLQTNAGLDDTKVRNIVTQLQK
jgi:tetratricopeptide (TPR) repeat protein